MVLGRFSSLLTLVSTIFWLNLMGYFAKGIIQKGRYRENGCFQIILFSLENDTLTTTYFACRFLHSLPHHFTLQKAYVCTCFSFC